MADEKTVTDIYEMLEGSLPALALELKSVKGEITDVKVIAESNKRALRGDDGEPGMVHKVNTLCTEQVKIREMVQDHDDLLYKGKNENEPGLIAQVREGRRFRKTMNRLYWLLIGAVLVGIVNIILTFLPGG